MSGRPEMARQDRSVGTSYEQYLDQDRKEVPPFLRPRARVDLGNQDIATSRYTSRDFHEKEKEKLWPRVWQMVCRDEHIPETGDYALYDIAGLSFLVTRSAPGEIRAFYNACLHRGRMLRTESGSAKDFRCPFHGLTWNLDGSLKELPCRWDFGHVDTTQFSLPEARVATWGGWVFISMDHSIEPLEEYLEPVPQHFERWNLENSFVGVHVARVVRANWKATMEAFSEAWHSHDTHPQILPFTGDTNSQYDIFEENPRVDRMITPFGVPSPYLEGKISEQDVLDAITGMPGGRRPENAAEAIVSEGMTGRQASADLNRAMAEGMHGRSLDEASDAELVDAILYNVFPNFIPWGGFGPNINYRFRPNGDEHDSCIMEVMLLMRHPPDAPRPPAAPVRWLEEDEPWSNAEQLGGLGPVFDQDMANLPYVQLGMRNLRKGITLASYQESRIRNLHRMIDRYLAD